MHSQIKVHLRDSELAPEHFKGILADYMVENNQMKGSKQDGVNDKLEEMAVEIDVRMQRTIFVCKITTI